MKRLLLLLTVLLGSTAVVEAQYLPRRGTATPTACAVGDIWVDTDALTGKRVYVAESTGPCVWVLQGDGTAAGGGAWNEIDLVSEKAGADAGAQLAQAITDSAANGSLIVFDLVGAQASATNPFSGLTKDVNIYFPHCTTVTISVAGGWNIPAAAGRNIRLWGAGADCVKLTRTGTTDDVLTIAAAANGSSGTVYVGGMEISGGRYPLRLANVVASEFRNLKLNTGNLAVLLAEGAVTRNLFEDIEFSTCTASCIEAGATLSGQTTGTNNFQENTFHHVRFDGGTVTTSVFNVLVEGASVHEKNVIDDFICKNPGNPCFGTLSGGVMRRSRFLNWNIEHTVGANEGGFRSLNFGGEHNYISKLITKTAAGHKPTYLVDVQASGNIIQGWKSEGGGTLRDINVAAGATYGTLEDAQLNIFPGLINFGTAENRWKMLNIYDSTGVPFQSSGSSPLSSNILGFKISTRSMNGRYNARVYNSADLCAAITEALADAGTGVVELLEAPTGVNTCVGGWEQTRGQTVILGNVWIEVGASIVVREGAVLRGAFHNAPDAAQSTIIAAKNGLNADIIVLQNAAGAAQWWHWGRLEGIRIEGNKANQTAGDCVQVDQIGETSVISDLLLQDCFQSGLRATGIAAGPHKIENLTINGTGTAATDAALNLDNTTSTYVIENIKGDGNRRMLRIDANCGGLGVILTKLQGENAVAGDNDPFIYIDSNDDGCGPSIMLNGVFPPGGVAKTNIILSEGATAIVKVNNLALDSSPYTNIITDGSKIVRVRDINGVFTGDFVDWSYNWGTVSQYYGSVSKAVTAANGTNNNLVVGENTHIRITGPTAAFTITGISNGDAPASCTVDCVVDGHMVWLFNTTAQTMSFTHQDAGSSDVFRIITRTGGTVNVGPNSVATLTYSKVDDRWVLWNDDYSTTTDTAGAIVKRDSSGIAKATIFDATTGFRIGGAAATGNVLRGNGTNFISTQLDFADLSGTLALNDTPLTTRGDLLTVNATPALIRLALGGAARCLVSDGSDAVWSSANCVTTSSTDTLTNKTIDDEGTGNNITRVAEIDIDGAACVSGTAALNWDAPVGTGDTAPAAACNDTGSIQRPSADFSGSAVNSMERTIRLPLGWTGDIDLTVEYVTVAATPTGNVEWDISTVCRAVGESWDASFNAAQTITDAVGAQNAINGGTQAAITVTGCAAEEHLTIKVSRDGVNDTNNDLAKLLKVYIKLRHTK